MMVCYCDWCVRKRVRKIKEVVVAVCMLMVLGAAAVGAVMIVVNAENNRVPEALRNAMVPVMNNIEPDQRP